MKGRDYLAKKLNQKEINDIRGLAKLVFENAKVLPDDEYQRGLLEGHPVICAKWTPDLEEQSKQVWKSEQLQAKIKRPCSICKETIIMGEINKAATFPICLECFMEYHEELREDLGGNEEGAKEQFCTSASTKENDEAMARRLEASAEGMDVGEDSERSDSGIDVPSGDGSVAGS